MDALPDGPHTLAEAHSMLAHHALNQLWYSSDFQPRDPDDPIWGCCPGCCAPCGALLYLDRQGFLDQVLAAWPEGSRGDSAFPDGRLDRSWMYRQWAGSPVQEQCGHRMEVSA